MKSTSIKTLVVGIMALAVAILTLTSVSAIISLRNDLREYDGVVNIEIRSAQITDKMNIEFKRQVQEWKNVLIRGSDDDQRNKYWGRFQEQEDKIQALGDQLLPLIQDKPEFADMARDFLASHVTMGQAYRTGFNDFVDADYNHTAGDKAVSGIDREPSALLDALSSALTDSSTEHGAILQSKAQSLVRLAIGSVLGIAIFLVALSYLLIVRFITTPLRTTSEALRKIAQGDLTDIPDASGLGEIGTLNESAFTLHKQLSDLISGLRNSISQLAEASQAMHSNAQQQAGSANEQQMQTEQASTAVEELSSSAGEIARSANETSDRTQDTTTSARDGAQQMSGVNTLMQHLRGDIESAGKAVGELSNRVTRVDEVMTVISGIAEQTNLLALNAAIEAARAGEQGRGFAVVADEVRALAQKTQESTTEIAEVLTGLRQGSEETVTAMQNGQAKTDEVVTNISEVSERWQVLADSINEISGLNATVATAATEQTSVTGEISGLISSLHDAAQLLQDQASNSATSSETLDQLATSLTEQISRFKL